MRSKRSRNTFARAFTEHYPQITWNVSDMVNAVVLAGISKLISGMARNSHLYLQRNELSSIRKKHEQPVVTQRIHN